MDKGASLRDRATRPADQAPAGLGESASVPSAHYDTYVFCSRTSESSRELFAELRQRFPFGDRPAPTRMIAWSSSDAMSVSDAMRMALECRELDDLERIDLALELAEAGSWEACLAKVAELDLAHQDGEFVAAIATEAGTATTVEQGVVHEGAGRRHRPEGASS